MPISPNITKFSRAVLDKDSVIESFCVLSNPFELLSEAFAPHRGCLILTVGGFVVALPTLGIVRGRTSKWIGKNWVGLGE